MISTNSRLYIYTCFLGLLCLSCRKPEPFPENGYDERLSGGIQTVFDQSSRAYTHEFFGMKEYDEYMHELGDGAFEQIFVTAPAPVNSGLGPAFNNVSCISCHHLDGSGVPSTGLDESALLMRISRPGTDEHGGPLPVPGYGSQLQDKAIFSKVPECRVNISYTYQTYFFPDGESYELRSPDYTLTDLYIPINGSYMLSPRLAPPIFGLGLLEAIDEAYIIANADVNDANSDGISGKANYVWDPLKKKNMLGRFGLKANTATLRTQVAAAYNNDIGVTSYVFPIETVSGQMHMDGLNDDYELADSLIEAVRFYVQSLAVPARRNIDDAEVKRGKEIFNNAKCAACHIPVMHTAANMTFPSVSNQRIYPYTDMLVHDMGELLADNRPDFLADGHEWRTPPLWGIGLRQTVNYPAYYMHDGRARTLTEAIMWHGGEAKQSADVVKQLSTADRKALLKFLNSL